MKEQAPLDPDLHIQQALRPTENHNALRMPRNHRIYTITMRIRKRLPSMHLCPYTCMHAGREMMYNMKCLHQWCMTDFHHTPGASRMQWHKHPCHPIPLDPAPKLTPACMSPRLYAWKCMKATMPSTTRCLSWVPPQPLPRRRDMCNSLHNTSRFPAQSHRHYWQWAGEVWCVLQEAFALVQGFKHQFELPCIRIEDRLLQIAHTSVHQLCALGGRSRTEVLSLH
jgi:hypothetical protein